ncbi:MAG TPA: hypothetical protein VHH36_10110, partial [Candidatus Thermoplasmatota archaeon]|nr:hypothetical protein [Candidatus Thermoplasmatota archaeon]
RECRRVLRPGGALYVFDLATPEDRAAAGVIDRIERLRDPSHVSSWPPSVWRRALADAGLAVERLDETSSEFDLEPWLARAGMGAAREAEARRLLREHDPASLGGYGVFGPGKMRVLRVEIVARAP